MWSIPEVNIIVQVGILLIYPRKYTQSLFFYNSSKSSNLCMYNLFINLSSLTSKCYKYLNIARECSGQTTCQVTSDQTPLIKIFFLHRRSWIFEEGILGQHQGWGNIQHLLRSMWNMSRETLRILTMSQDINYHSLVLMMFISSLLASCFLLSISL